MRLQDSNPNSGGGKSKVEISHKRAKYLPRNFKENTNVWEFTYLATYFKTILLIDLVIVIISLGIEANTRWLSSQFEIVFMYTLIYTYIKASNSSNLIHPND